MVSKVIQSLWSIELVYAPLRLTGAGKSMLASIAFFNVSIEYDTIT